MKIRTQLDPDEAAFRIQRMVRKRQEKNVEEYLSKVTKKTGKVFDVALCLRMIRKRRLEAKLKDYSPEKKQVKVRDNSHTTSSQSAVLRFFAEAQDTQDDQGKKMAVCTCCFTKVAHDIEEMKLHLLSCKSAIEKRGRGRPKKYISTDDSFIETTIVFECEKDCGFEHPDKTVVTDHEKECRHVAKSIAEAPFKDVSPNDNDEAPDNTKDVPSKPAKSVGEWKAGMEVKAQWSKGKRWYIARIVKINDDGTFHLVYNDGGVWEQCPAEKMLPRTAEISSDKMGTKTNQELTDASESSTNVESIETRVSVPEQ